MQTAMVELAPHCTDIHISNGKGSPSHQTLEYAGAGGTCHSSY